MYKNALIMFGTIVALVLAALGVDVALREPDSTPTTAARPLPTETPAEIETPTPTTETPTPTPTPTTTTPPTSSPPPSPQAAPTPPPEPSPTETRPGNPEVYQQIAAETNCARLQETFDRAYENNKTAAFGSEEAKWTLEYMKAADSRMRELGCFN
jgi:outer membrane biosynthesis protein TonB